MHRIAPSDSVSEAAKIFTQTLDVLHSMIDIYGAFGFLSINFEWGVCLRIVFTGVILTHVDSFQPIFSKIRKII